MLKTRYAFPIAALGLAILTLLVASLIAVSVIRALPGRYAYYLPGPLQNLRHSPSHPDTLPTPVAAWLKSHPSPPDNPINRLNETRVVVTG